MTTTPHPTHAAPTHPGTVPPGTVRPDALGTATPVDHEQPTTVLPTEQPTHRAVVAEQRRRFGGIKWGSAFFGWLTATGAAVLLTAIAVGIGAAGGWLVNPAPTATFGLVAAIIGLVVLFLAYYAGGYVAGRMARFDGVKQGFAVWLWSLIVAAVVTAAGLIMGPRFSTMASIDGLPPLPITAENITTTGVVAALVALAAALLGALLGGLAGMRFHRRIDRTDLEIV
ncbi:hypothetical protein [Pseudonocardia sp. GCM10023141]|uniref:hypothetical protein n=1 Tax=Pseudonocardia sp. GCM10023141 TaxID=3252653 RepID=UPI00360BB191